jgi:hypothetical protein
MKPVYCFDSCALIEPWTKYYSPDICNDYWQVLEGMIERGELFCSSEVFEEVKKQEDGLSSWLSKHKRAVMSIDDEVQNKIREILRDFPTLIDTKRDRSMADPWVVAHAIVKKATVVTKELPVDSTRTAKVKIPNVCNHYGIRYIDDFMFVKEIGLKFSCIS